MAFGCRLGIAAMLLIGCGRTEIGFGDASGGGDAGAWSGALPDEGLDDGPNGGGGGGVQQCREVDVLFVIDDSPTMAAYQSNVVSNYDVFVDGLQDALQTLETMHVGVVTASAYPHAERGCDVLGGLVTQTAGPASSNATCGPFASAGNYLTDRDDLDAHFPCIAQVGNGGADLDTPMAAALHAISPPLTDPGECNEGFFNPGALLVLVIVTDTYPNMIGLTDLDPYFVGTSIAEAAGGFDDVVVVLIASTEDSPCQNPLAPELEDFAGLFDHAFAGGICETDYSRLFGPAIDVVKAACPE